MRAFVLLAVFAVGCVKQAAPVEAPPTKPVVYASVADVDSLKAELRSLHDHAHEAEAAIAEAQTLKAQVDQLAARTEEADAAAKYTGIKMLTRGDCPPCQEFKRQFALEPAAKGWTLGDGPQFHVWTVHSDGTVPQFQFVRDGVVYDTKTGFTGDVWDIVRLHPRVKRPKATVKQSLSVPVIETFEIVEPPVFVAPTMTIAPNSLPTIGFQGFRSTKMPYSAIDRQAARKPSGVNYRGPQWSWPGNTSSSLRRHMMSEPHRYSAAQVQSMSDGELRRLHSAEHQRHASVTGNRGNYVPYMSGPFKGSLKNTAPRSYAAPRYAPPRRCPTCPGGRCPA